MKIQDILFKNAIITDLKAAPKNDVLNQLGRFLASIHSIKDPDHFVQKILEREADIAYESGVALDTLGDRPAGSVPPQPPTDETAPAANTTALAWFWVTAVVLLVGVGAAISFMPVREVEEAGEAIRTGRPSNRNSPCSGW